MKDFHDWFEENYKAWLRMRDQVKKGGPGRTRDPQRSPDQIAPPIRQR